MYHEIHVEEVVGLDEEEVAEGLDEGAWMSCMKQRISNARSDGPFHREHLIYRVNSLLRKGNESCFEPIATSIGPYHHGKEHLLDMETHKWRYVHHLLSRNKNIRFEDLVKMMKDRQKEVRACYPGKIELESKAFVEMMLLDGCFIVEFLLKLRHRHGNDDLFVGPSWRLITLLQYDLVLLENQLPFFLLQEIFNAVMPDETDPLALVKLSFKIWESKILKSILLTANLKEVLPEARENVHHLLHLLHMQFNSIPAIFEFMHQQQLQDSKIPKCNNLAVTCPCMFNCCKGTTHEQEQTVWMPSVTQLEEAEVKFKASSSNLLDIKFSKGELIIPTIIVSDETEAQLQNLVAFEQCCLVSSQDYYFSTYVIFMDHLINTSKDVEILHKKGILRQRLVKNEDVALLFNKINKGLCIERSGGYLGGTLKMVNQYSTRKTCKCKLYLRCLGRCLLTIASAVGQSVS